MYVPCGTLGACGSREWGCGAHIYMYAFAHTKIKVLVSRPFIGLVYLPPR